MLPARAAVEIPGAPPSHLKKKTMIKDRVGSVRTTSYQLPEEKHVCARYCQIRDRRDALVADVGNSKGGSQA